MIESMRKKLILVLLPVLSVFTLSFNCHASVSRSDLKFIKKNLDFFATPVVHQVEASSQLSEGIFAAQKGSPEDKGVIYSIGVGGLESIKLRLTQQKDLEKNQLQKAARSLTRASCKTFKGRLSCRGEARQRRFKKAAAIKEEAHKMLSELSQKTQDLNLHRNIDEPINNAVKTMKLHWVHKPQMTVDMIYEDLVLNRYEHVIIISHASSDGLLFDSQQNEIDPNLFRIFGESVQSLTVFSCFVDKVESKYKWLSGEKSLFPSRYFINLPISDEIGNFAVNKGDDFFLSKFLKNVDDYLFHHTTRIKYTLAQRGYQKLNFSGFRSQGMAYSIKLNGLFVGVISSVKNEVYLDPNSLKKGRNALVVGCLNINPLDKSKLKKEEQSFKIFLDNEDISAKYLDVKYKHLGFVENKGLYRNSRISFNL